MSGSHEILYLGTLSVAVVHTVIGPDHYLPFIVLGRAEGWTLRKTLLWTVICGVGHVLSSVLVGMLGVGLGWALSSVERFEGVRGQLATWGLILFGSAYFLWGLWRGRRGHSHVHVHADGSLHRHPHPHEQAAAPTLTHESVAHDDPPHVRAHRRTLWVLFIIFVLGPCEPLIGLLLAPGAQRDVGGVVALATLFSLTTVVMMVALVTCGWTGVRLVRLQRLERYAHAMAGFAILVSGLMIRFLGV